MGTSFEEIATLLTKIKELEQSKDECQKYFETVEDMLAFTSEIAKAEFDEAVKTNPRVNEVGRQISIKMWTAKLHGNTTGRCPCGICYSVEYFDISRPCRKCLYGQVLGYQFGSECGYRTPAEMLASFENPEFLALVKAADDKLEAKYELNKITGWRKYLDKCADRWKESQEEWRKYFETEKDMENYTAENRQKEFNELIKANGIWYSGWYVERKRIIANKNGYGTLVHRHGFCMSNAYLELKYCNSQTCPMGTKNRDGCTHLSLEQLNDPKLLAMIDEWDKKLEAEAEHKQFMADAVKAGKLWKQQQSEKQSEYLKCPECGNDQFWKYAPEMFPPIKFSTITGTSENTRDSSQLVNNEYVYICTDCKTTFKYKLTPSGQLVKIKRKTNATGIDSESVGNL